MKASSSPLIPSTNPKSSEMSSQTLIFLMVLFFVQLASSPIQALPSHQAPSSGTSYSDLNDKSPSREMHGRLREQTSHEGDGTYYSPGLGSCGQQSGNDDLIVAISHALYDSNTEGQGDSNALVFFLRHTSHLCGKSIRASYGANSIVVTVVDRCEGCSSDDLDFSPAAFRKLSPLNSGRLHGISVITPYLQAKPTML
ncbi:hypothetical protein VP01_2631g4 [Puccinia sorghi]|uniref:RlpA-like protein double-psi beta-barrel domain-containing protein n=1 Tax=Puccinia sorghi TaxID=27349 RepID=A0A0L6V4E6_9BASI|nr:hypothetical protein VP01_2631g4 [Puccinia sorghi]